MDWIDMLAQFAGRQLFAASCESSIRKICDNWNWQE